MDTSSRLHPNDQTLHAYGLGKLDDRSSESVEQHLDDCPECRQRVGELSGDSFLGRLQHAHPRAGAPAAGTLPPELADHADYQVVKELGRGGMGVVYLAHNRLMGRDEVLKVVGKHLITRQSVLDRFLREIRSAARLHHPNIVAAYSAMRLGDSVVLAMEYVEGLDLARMVKTKGPLPVAHAAYFIHQAALGLQHAHDRGMVHRDIKPANLILARDGKKAVVKVLDFGLAKVTSEKPVDGDLTQEGQMLGTPDYIAPEQTINAQTADIRADIYSLGCTLYYLLTGGPPFRGTSLYDILQAHHSMNAAPLNIVRPEVPLELAALVAKMMAKEPERRFQTPAAVAQALMPFFKAGAAQGSRSSLDIPQSGLPAAPAPPAPPTQAATPAPATIDRSRQGAEEPAWANLIKVEKTETSDGFGPVRPPSRAEDGRRSWVGWSLAAGLLMLGLVAAGAAGVFKVKTPDGTIVVENVPEQAEVFVDNRLITVKLPEAGEPWEISVPPGTHRVEVRKNGIKVSGEEVTVGSGGKAGFTVRLERPVTPPAGVAVTPGTKEATNPLPELAARSPGATVASAVEDGYVSLFNGKDLAGWKSAPGQPAIWRVDGGILIGAGQENGYLYSDRSDYQDFRLRAETRVNDRGNSGISFRFPLGGNWTSAYEAQIGVNTGTLCVYGEFISPIPESHIPADRWFTLEVIAEGNRIATVLDGKIVSEFTDERHPSSRGHIALEFAPSSDRPTVVEFRKIEIKEFRGPTRTAGAAEAPLGVPATPAPSRLTASRAIKVLIITGDDEPAHDWQKTTNAFRVILGDPARFQVDVTTTPAEDLIPGYLARYDVFLLNYKDTPQGKPETRWSAANRTAFLNSVSAEGKGLYVHHYASGAFTKPNWTEFERATAGGFRTQGLHGPPHGFTVKTVDTTIPQFGDLPTSFEHVRDELYANSLLTPRSVVLATAYSDPAKPRGTGKDEPVIWVNQYGRGRVVNNVLGHDTAAMNDPNYQIWVRRGIEWAAGDTTGLATSDANRPAQSARAKAATPVPAGPRVPADARVYRGRSFKVFPQELSWHMASQTCRSMGGHLAIVTSEEENQFLVSLMKNQGITAAWLGATDEKSEGRWVWVDGTPMRYSHWDLAARQPNNKQGLEHYLMLLLSSDGKWADQPDRSFPHKPGFVCQWE